MHVHRYYIHYVIYIIIMHYIYYVLCLTGEINDELLYLLYRLVGTYSLYAQQLVYNGELSINEPLVDSNNRMLEVRAVYT